MAAEMYNQDMLHPRAFVIGILTAVCVSAVSGFIVFSTIQNTILDREVTKGWLRESGVYKNLTDSVVQSGATGQASALASTPAIKTAVEKTFTPAYAQQTTEKTLDGFYDWAEGDTPNLDIDLSLSDKQPELTANLATELSGQLATLPACASAAEFNAQAPTCVPAGLDTNQAAQHIAAQAVGGAEASTTAQDNPAVPVVAAVRGVPSMMDTVRLWVKLTPTIAIVSAVLIFAIAAARLRALLALSARLLIGTGLTLALGLLLAYFGQAVSLDYISNNQQAVVRQILEPVIQIAVPDIGRELAIISGSVALCVALAGLLLLYIRHRWYGQPAPAVAMANPVNDGSQFVQKTKWPQN